MASSTLWRTNSSGEAQALRVEDAVVADDQGVLERGAERVTRAPELRHVAHEAEGAGAGDFAAEGVGVDVVARALAADQRMVEVDLDLDAEAARIRAGTRRSVAERDADRLEDWM